MRRAQARAEGDAGNGPCTPEGAFSKVLLSSVLRSDNTPAFTSSLMFTEPTLFTVSQSLSWILRKGGQIMQKKRKKENSFSQNSHPTGDNNPSKTQRPSSRNLPELKGKVRKTCGQNLVYGTVLYAAHTHTFGNSPSDSKCSSNDPTWGMPSVSHWNPDWPRGWVGKREQTPQNLWATAVSLAVT